MALGHNTVHFQFISELVKPSRIDARAQSHGTRLEDKAWTILRRGLCSKTSTNCVVEGFLEGLATLMHGGAQQALSVPIESHRRSHGDSMMLAIHAVKMTRECPGRFSGRLSVLLL